VIKRVSVRLMVVKIKKKGAGTEKIFNERDDGL
jgi:hypothetical protein